jgi:TatD DNase family protein
MKPFLVDTHCHLHFRSYDADRALVLNAMEEKRVWGITIGTGLANSAEAIKLAEKTDGIWATVGLHPSHTTSEHVDEDEGEEPERTVSREQLTALASSSKKCVAIGECGLDFYRLPEDREAAIKIQEEVFKTHIEAAKQLDLPLVIHCREALSRLAEILQEFQASSFKLQGVVHSFTGTWEEAKPLLDLGMYIAVNGIATFPLRKGQDPETAINRTIEQIPLDKLLLETDAPWLAPAPYRGKRNEPSYVEEVAHHVAKVRRMSVKDIAEQTTKNAIALFGLHE